MDSKMNNSNNKLSNLQNSQTASTSSTSISTTSISSTAASTSSNPPSTAQSPLKSSLVSSYDYDDANAAPLHLHALPIELSSSSSSMLSTSRVAPPSSVPTTSTSHSTSRSRSSSRSRSRAASFSSSRSSSPSSSSSATRILDPNDDILLDKLGLLELQQTGGEVFDTSFLTGSTTDEAVAKLAKAAKSTAASSSMSPVSSGTSLSSEPQIPILIQPQPQQQHHQRKSTLPCVNERMSDESLDDVHAFTDLRNVVKQIKIPSDASNSSTMGSSSASSRSREGSVAGSLLGDANFLLETLEEFEGENEEDEDDDAAKQMNISQDLKENISSMTIVEES